MERLTGRFKDGGAFILPSVVSKLSPMKSEIIEKLADYEDAEEQGLLLRLPCKVGDVVAIVLMIPSTGKRCIEQAEVKEINIGKYNTREDIQLKVEPIARRGTVYKYYVSEWGENIFPTLSEAEKALADMGV